MSRDDCPYIDRVPNFDVKDGVVCMNFGSWSLFMPLRVFRLGLTRARETLKLHDASGQVLPFKGG